METTYQAPFTKRETYFFYNSLLCLVKALENRYTTIDLKNELCVTGKIKEVDGYMNVMLTDAALYDTDGKYRYFPMLHIQSRNIRYVHIPDNMPIEKTIKSQVIKQPQKVVKEKLTFKKSRAIRKQKETLQLIEEMKKMKKKSEGGDKDENKTTS